MPAPLSAELLAHLEGDVTTLAICVKITRADATVLGFTSLDRALVIDGVTYEPETGWTPSAVKLESGTKAGGLDAVAFLRSQAITAVQVLGGLYKGAWADVFFVNWRDLTQGRRTLMRGVLGEASIQGATVKQEFTPLIKLAQTQVVSLASASCQVKEFGDAQCGVNLAPLTFTANVTAVSSKRVFRASSLVGRSERFVFGRLTVLSGPAAGEKRVIKAFTSATGEIELQEAIRGEIAIGNQVQVIAGCDRKLSTCKAYSNVVNFRGLPYIPGPDAVLKVPD